MFSKKGVIVSILVLSLGIPPSWAVEKEVPKTPPVPEKSSITLPPQIDWFASLATSMAAAATAILAIRSFPDNLKSSVQAFKDLRAFKTIHRPAYLGSIKDLEDFTEREKRLLGDLSADVDEYLPVLDALDKHIRKDLPEPKIDADKEKLKEIAEHVRKLRELGGPGIDSFEVHSIVNQYRKQRTSKELEEWIDRHQNDIFQTAVGGEWLERYSRLRQEYGVLKWALRGSVKGIESWINTFQNRPVGQRRAFLEWVLKYYDLKEEEKIAASEFLDDFAEFTLRLNRDIRESEAKFAVLLTLNKREPGVFHSEEGHGPVPLYAGKLNSHAENRCKRVLGTLAKNRDNLGELGSYWALLIQPMKVATPLMTGLGAFGGGYLAVKGFFRLLNTDPTKPIPPPGTLPGIIPGNSTTQKPNELVKPK